jgi:carbamoyl-phosphate synthase large subunit
VSVVLVTGAGGAALPALIGRLKASGHHVIAADADPHAPGLYLADVGLVVPFGNSPEFGPALRRACERHRVDVVIPLVDEELVSAIQLEDGGRIAVLTPRRAFIETCLDKFALMRTLSSEGIDVPTTTLASEHVAEHRFPVIVKPRVGRGSRGVHRVAAPGALAACLAAHPLAPADLLVQNCVDGPEYTVSVTVWRDGGVLAVVPKEIIVKRGVTRIAVTRRHPAIDDVCHRIQQRLRADGPFNVQLCLTPDGRPLPFEINPRFSTTVSLTAAAGIDEPGLLVDLAHGAAPGPLAWKDGVVLLRHGADSFMSEASFRAATPGPA